MDPVADPLSVIPIEVWEVILDRLSRADILLCRILSQNWNIVILSYLKSSKRGRAISPIVTLASDEHFMEFTSLIRRGGGRNVPFYKFCLNVVGCTVGVVKNFGIVSGHLVTECILQIHPLGFYDMSRQFHGSTTQILTPVVEYSAYVKMAILLRRCSNIVKLSLCQDSVNVFQLHPIFIPLPKCLHTLKTLVIRYYYGDPHMDELSQIIKQPFLKGHDFISAVVKNGRNIETLMLEPYCVGSRQRNKQIARIIDCSKNIPRVSIYGCDVSRDDLELFPIFEETSSIRILEVYVSDFELGESCILQIWNRIFSKMSETLVTLSLGLRLYCRNCNERNYKLPQLNRLQELSLSFGKFLTSADGECRFKLPRTGPLLSGHFPNLRCIKFANPNEQQDVSKGFQCDTVHTLELRPWPNFHKLRWDVIFPNIKTVAFYLPARRTPADNYESIIPFVLRYMTRIEVLYASMYWRTWETLTGDQIEPTHQELLALPAQSKFQIRNVSNSCSFANLKHLRCLNLNVLCNDALTLKAFIYLSKIHNFKVPSFTINCDRPHNNSAVHQHFMEYLTILESLYSGFTYTLRVRDVIYRQQNHQTVEHPNSPWRFLGGRYVDWATFTSN